MNALTSILEWFSGGQRQYHNLYHCMMGDNLWITITVILDLTVAAGYLVIAKHWYTNERNLPAIPAKKALGNMRNIFIFCGLCGYIFIPIKMFWPAWRLYDMFLVILAIYTWRYALSTKGLKVIYNELGRSNQLTADLNKARAEAKEKSSFLNALSHDLRTPLNALSLHAQVLRLTADRADKAAMLESIAEIEANAHASAELLDRLLQCAKLDFSQEPNNVSSVDVAALVEKTVQSQQMGARAKGLTLDAAAATGFIIRSDALKLERILANLIGNAIKFTHTGGIKVALEGNENGVEIHVIDSGIGLSDDQQARLFKEFFQVHNDERDRNKGFGLGLAISRKLARQLGGDITVDSAPGKGSRFSVVLPAAAPDVPPSPAESATPTADPAAGELSVVIPG